MANATCDLPYEPIGSGGRSFNLPVDGGTTIYKGTLISQLDATAMAVPTSTASSGPAIAVAEAGIDNAAGADGDKRVMVHTDRIFTFANGTGGNACSEATALWAEVFAYDDHTVYDNSAGGTLQRAGYFAGMEPDGRVRVYVYPGAIASATVTSLETRVSDAEDATTSLETRVSEAEDSTTSLETRVSDAEDGTTSLETRVSDAEDATTSLETRVSDAEDATTSLETRVSTEEVRTTYGYAGVPLTAFREIDASGDVGNGAANGGVLASDTTPILEADAAESLQLNWATGNVDAVGVSIPVPGDYDQTKDMVVSLLVASGVNDAATFTLKTSFNGGAQVTDTADDAATKSASLHAITATIAHADIPAGALSMSMQLIPDAHAANAILLQAVQVRYARV
jgi:hypothetical protein